MIDTIFAQDTIQTVWSPMTKEHYENLGYTFTGYFTSLEIKVCHLLENSNIKIEVICPKCKNLRMAKYAHITKVGNSQCHICSRVNNRSGKIFGRLTALSVIGRTRGGDYIWKCLCECGNIVEVDNSSLGRGVFSCGCFRAEKIGQLAKMQTGSNHPRWNPELTNEEREGRRDLHKVVKWRLSVYKRDNFICQGCGYSKGDILIAHHLNSYARFPELRFEISNGITFCELCHKEFHKIYSYNNFTVKEFKKWQQMKII